MDARGKTTLAKAYPNAFLDLNQKIITNVMKINKDGSQPRIVAIFTIASTKKIIIPKQFITWKTIKQITHCSS